VSLLSTDGLSPCEGHWLGQLGAVVVSAHDAAVRLLLLQAMGVFGVWVLLVCLECVGYGPGQSGGACGCVCVVVSVCVCVVCWGVCVCPTLWDAGAVLCLANHTGRRR